LIYLLFDYFSTN